MKCCFTHDIPVNPATMAESEKSKIRFRKGVMRRRHPVTGRTEEAHILDAYFPKGTVYENDRAWVFVLNGDADPADDECAEVCGLTSDEIAALQRAQFKQEHIAVSDWDLFDKGVIVGYDENGPDGYKPGPAWEAYQQALSEVDKDEDDDE